LEKVFKLLAMTIEASEIIHDKSGVVLIKRLAAFITHADGSH